MNPQKFFAFALLLLALVMGTVWQWWISRTGTVELVFSAGEQGGRYLRVARAMSHALESELSHLTIKVIQSQGSEDNLHRLQSDGVDRADLALVQNDSEGGDRVRTLAVPYHEVLHFLVRRDSGISSMKDLLGKKVSVGAKNSGTYRLVSGLLLHHGLTMASFELHSLPMSEAAEQLVAGELDVMFCVSGLRHPACARAMASGQVAMIGLGEADLVRSAVVGFKTVYPYVDPVVVPVNVYPGQEPGTTGQPELPVATLSVPAILVVRREMDDDLARSITRTLFERRASLVRQEPSLSQMKELISSEGLQYPLHEGAEDFYHRSDPGFLVTYAESMGFLLSAMLAFWGVMVGVAGWMKQRKKDRLDLYFVSIERIMSEVSDENPETRRLHALNRDLTRLRHQAVQEMVSEKLLADESFRIFQTMLSDCQAMVEKRIALAHDSEN